MEVRILVHLQSGDMTLDDYIELLSWIKTRVWRPGAFTHYQRRRDAFVTVPGVVS